MLRFLLAASCAAVGFVPSIGQAAAPPSCPPDGPAIIAHAVTPDKPPMAMISRAGGTATVRVDLSSTGALLGAHVVHSSGSAVLDKGALDAVKALVFAPGSQSCMHVDGSYNVDVTYPE